MTAPHLRRSVRDWFLPALVGLVALSQAVMWPALISLLKENGERAAQGRAARVQQCGFREISLAEQEWFRARGVISGSDLARIKRALPSAEQCRALNQK